MKVVFLEEVEGTASPGDVKNVANGFARNYLLPRKLAAPATEHYISIAKAKATKHARRQDRLDEEATAHLLPKVDGRTFRMEVRVGEQGKLFGSVTARDIAEAVQAETGVELTHQQVALGQAIREVGSQEITVRLTKNVHAQITVSVEPLGGAGEEAQAPQEPSEAEESPPEPEAAAEPEESAAEPEAAAEPAEPETAAEPEAADSAPAPENQEEPEDTSESG